MEVNSDFQNLKWLLDTHFDMSPTSKMCQMAKYQKKTIFVCFPKYRRMDLFTVCPVKGEFRIENYSGKSGPGGKDSPAWEPDATTKVQFLARIIIIIIN